MIRHDTSTQVWDGGECSWGSRKPGPAEQARAQQMEGPFALKGQEQGRRRAGERSSVSCAPAPRAGGGGGRHRTAGKAHAAAPCRASSRFCESPAAEARKFSISLAGTQTASMKQGRLISITNICYYQAAELQTATDKANKRCCAMMTATWLLAQVSI